MAAGDHRPAMLRKGAAVLRAASEGGAESALDGDAPSAKLRGMRSPA
ncbi:MAG TPA: hypothetical protein VGN83_28870 [Falsiroseomonas sp.]|jgi:hypothetical protein|nr:hypothetical protein [Falsiroseomonas sp.]